MNTKKIGSVEVCEECYFAYHYGADEATATTTYINDPEGAEKRSAELLKLIEDQRDLTDWTYPSAKFEHRTIVDEDGDEVRVVRLIDYDGSDITDQADGDTGITDFSWKSCDGCGSDLGGSRYRLAMWSSES